MSSYSLILGCLLLMSCGLLWAATPPTIHLSQYRLVTAEKDKVVEIDQKIMDCIHQQVAPRLNLSHDFNTNQSPLKDFEKKPAGAKLDNSDLQILRQTINSQCFYQQGYINSGIIYPNQSFQQNELIIELIEGQINQISIDGNHALNPDWFNQQLSPALKKPFRLDHLRQSLLLMEQHPIIQKIDTKLLPSTQLGHADLELNVVEQSPYEFQFELNNTLASPSVGQAFFNLTAKHHSMTGRGDSLRFESSYSQGLKKAALAYLFPLNAHSRVGFDYLYGQSKIVEAPFDRLAIKNRIEQFGLSYEYDLSRNLNQIWQLYTGLSYERSESELLGRSFSFAPGVENGKSRLSTLDLGIRWQYQQLKNRRVDQIWSLDSQWQVGIPIFSATKNRRDPDSQFFKWLLQGQWRKRLSEDGKYQWLSRVNAQWSNTALLPLEVYSVGGINSVRGYRQSQFSRDIGWSSSFNLVIRVNPKLELSPFLDLGQAWNQDYRERAKLSSIGLAIHWRMSRNWQWYGHYAKRLSETRSQGDSLQDKGFGFQLQYRMR